MRTRKPVSGQSVSVERELARRAVRKFTRRPINVPAGSTLLMSWRLPVLLPASPSARSTRPVRIMYQKQQDARQRGHRRQHVEVDEAQCLDHLCRPWCRSPGAPPRWLPPRSARTAPR